MRRRTFVLLVVLVLVLAPAMFQDQPARAQPANEGIYQLSPDGFPVADEDGEGGLLVSGKPVQGTVFPKGSSDVYTILGQANQWFAIEVMGSNGLRPQVEVLYPNGKLLTELHGELTAKKQVQLMTTGVYEVVVKSYPYPSLTTGTYTLKVTIGNSRV